MRQTKNKRHTPTATTYVISGVLLVGFIVSLLSKNAPPQPAYQVPKIHLVGTVSRQASSKSASPKAASPISPAPTRLVLFVAGQSNATGWESYAQNPPNALSATLATAAAARDTITWNAAPPPFGVLPPPTNLPVPLATPQYKTAAENTTTNAQSIFGPEISLATTITTDTGRPVTVVKYTVPGTSLATQWGSSTRDHYYTDAVRFLKATFANDAARGQTDVLGGFYWYQGESDAVNPAQATAYKSNLENMLRQFRKDVPQKATTPIVLVQPSLTTFINTSLAFHWITAQQAAQIRRGIQKVRSADATIASTTNAVYLIDSAPLPRTNNFIHLSAAAELTLGTELAKISEPHLPKQ